MMTEQPSTRRSFLATLASAVAASSTLARDFGQNAGPPSQPDPDVIALDDSFKKYIQADTSIRRLHTGCLWSEGPAWNGSGSYLVWSDIPNDRLMRYLPEDGHVSIMRTNADNCNGNTFDWNGRQLTCEQSKRRVVRFEPNGNVTVLAFDFEGKSLNAPDDIVVHPDGGIWFTDPGVLGMGNKEGVKVELLLKESVYRLDPTGKITMVNDEMEKPNGLCFSPDYQKLYVSDSGKPRNIMSYEMVDGKKLGKGKELCVMKSALTDKDGTGSAGGIRCDVDGNVWASAGGVGEGYDGVHVINSEGRRIGQIKLPETGTNLCFGGTRHNHLYITAGQSLYSVIVGTQGAHFC